MNTQHCRRFLSLIALTGATLAATTPRAQAVPEIFAFAADAEIQEHATFGLKQAVTLRSGKDVGRYRAWDFETEATYGLTDSLELSTYIEQHQFDISGNEHEINDRQGYAFSGGGVGLKWLALKEHEGAPVSLALKGRVGYSPKDELDGSSQRMLSGRLDLILQKEFFDGRLITVLNGGAMWATGKHPAESYNNEMILSANAGATWKFDEHWALGVEGYFMAEEAMKPDGHALYTEHHVFYAGPALHYASENWWVTLGYMRQIGGRSAEERDESRTYAKQVDDQFRIKFGINF